MSRDGSPLHNLCSHPALDFPSSARYSRKNWRAACGSITRAPDFLAELRSAMGGRESSKSYVRFTRTAPGAWLAALTLGDLLGPGPARNRGVE
jgi:hypothetical protein